MVPAKVARSWIIWGSVNMSRDQQHWQRQRLVDAAKSQHRFRHPTNISDTDIGNMDLELPKSAEEEGKQEILF